MALTREWCRMCQHPVTVGFRVPDGVWQEVMHPTLRRRTVCLACFTRLADEMGVEWDDDIEFYPVSLVTLRKDADNDTNAVQNLGRR